MEKLNSKLGRRFLKTRNKAWAHFLANKLANNKITPNQISVCSLIFSVFAVVSLYFVATSEYFWLLTIFFIQLRLLCNMLDGLVAIEEKKASKLGDLYNDLPDRISDVFIILAFGFIAGCYNLSWFAALLAIFTAYLRLLFTSMHTPAYYCGPMAKQHRMALVSVGCLLCFIFPNFYVTTIQTVLILLNIGMLITIVNRLTKGINFLLCQ